MIKTNKQIIAELYMLVPLRVPSKTHISKLVLTSVG